MEQRILTKGVILSDTSETTKREKRKTGEIEHSVSIGSFQKELHQRIKILSSKNNSASRIYSNAISELRADFDAGIRVTTQTPAPDGKNIKVWVSEKARNDLRYLRYKLDAKNRTVINTAILRWLTKRELQKDGK